MGSACCIGSRTRRTVHSLVPISIWHRRFKEKPGKVGGGRTGRTIYPLSINYVVAAETHPHLSRTGG